MKNLFLNLVVAAAFVLATANLAQAASLGYVRDAQGGDGPFLSGAMFQGAGNINDWNGRAGTFDFELSLNGPNGNYFDLLTYCADPTRTLSVGPEGGVGSEFKIVAMSSFYPNASDVLAIEKLWALAFSDSQTSAVKAAAFQFLLWEYIGDSTFDLTSGMIRVNHTEVFAQAEAYNSQLSGATARALLLILDGTEANKQSFFIEQPVMALVENPEPGTYIMIGAGLLALTCFRRSRR